MKVDTIKGSSYVVTCTKACTVRAVLNSGGDSMLILETGEKGQYGFAAPTDAVEVSDDDARSPGFPKQPSRDCPSGTASSRGLTPH